MEDDKKNLLLALVDNHPSGRRQLVEDGGRPRDAAPQMDLIKGKGKGLIILLHGPPGVGKTLTAETIAMYTRRPLYAITCGDIGDTPKDIENSLDEHFRYAHKWGCVLLLDEADVFLAERKPGDIKRNAMVSGMESNKVLFCRIPRLIEFVVFLRVLEYYSGILFLTTNQVGRLDEAFKSRLRIPLHYPKIDRASTKQLWENHLNNIDRENIKRDVKITFNRPKLIDFALKHFDRNIKKDYTWNGRQVRNAFSTAIALAEYERLQNIRNQAVEDDVPEEQVMEKWYKTIKLTEEHFKKVSKTMKTFEKYLRSVRNDMTSADLMEQAQLRLDDWDPNAEPMHHEVKKNSGGIGGLSPNTPRTNGARRLSQAHTPSKKTTSHEAIGHKSESSDGESDSD
jgi:SpoVK/Ycf46/Vps4 family AAA+-type ATPase